MKEEQLMKDQRKRKCFLLITFLSVFLLYIVSEYISTNDSYDGNQYISQFLLPTESAQVALEESEGADETLSSAKLENNKTDAKDSIPTTNITITIIRAEDVETMVKVTYPDSETKRLNRNVFLEMKDINRSTENIFFIETRCTTEKMAVHFRGNQGFVLNARQCCAIESTALMNLDRDIYIFHSCSLDDNFLQYSPKFVEELFKYPNIYIVRLNMSEVFSGSPVEELDRKKLLETSNFPVEHSSDLLRLALLWRFGGTYCDLDVVTIRSLNNLKTNWAGLQDSDTIANGVLNFEPDGVGHNMLQRALEYVNKYYDPSNWSSNGPLLITPIILQECRVLTGLQANVDCHGNFTVFNSSVLYPIYYPSADIFFDDHLGKRIVEDVKKRSYSVHIWNKMSHEKKVTVGSTQAYALLANEFCPQVYSNCGNTF